MILDLAGQDNDRKAAADVAIIGGGIAGLLLAAKLRDSGITVAIVESGGRTQDDETHPLNRVLNAGTNYHGGIRGRARCLGGTSTMWGGALIPPLEQDFQPRPHLGLPAWPIALSELSPFVREVETIFGLQGGPYEYPFPGAVPMDRRIPLHDPDFLFRFAKWPQFKSRNVATLLGKRLETDQDLGIWLNATATRFECDQAAGRMRAIVARSPNARTLQLSARHFVVCAGGIESTRLLLLLDRQSGNRIFRGCDALGRYFHDHVSLPAARLVATRIDDLNRMAGFSFVGDTMRSLRFELSPAAQAEDGVASAFGHISFAGDGASGFDALRRCMRSLQKTGRIDARATIGVLRDLPYLARAAYWRLLHRQLLWPRPATYELHVVSEQVPRARNRIELAAEEDALGCPLAVIDWRIDELEQSTIHAFAKRFTRFWKSHGLDATARIEWRLDASDNGRAGLSDSAGDIFHPGGTTRMGLDPRTAVVDANLCTFTVPNLSVASTSVFASGASANPTLTLMALTLRLARHLATRLSAERVTVT